MAFRILSPHWRRSGQRPRLYRQGYRRQCNRCIDDAQLMHGEESILNGDAGYLRAEKRDDAIVRNKPGKKIRYEINRRPSQIRILSKSGQYKAKT